VDIFLIFLVAVLAVILTYFITRFTFEEKFRRWRDAEIENRKKAVQDGISKSRAVLGGKFTEQLVPYLPEFKYDPTEARFIGSPIDLIVFPGLSQGEPREIVIVEIKTGGSQLSTVENKIRQLVESGMVRWELIQRSG
jgi:predicted Holliday junction resolvase-like endonuclease